MHLSFNLCNKDCYLFTKLISSVFWTQGSCIFQPSLSLGVVEYEILGSGMGVKVMHATLRSGNAPSLVLFPFSTSCNDGQGNLKGHVLKTPLPQIPEWLCGVDPLLHTLVLWVRNTIPSYLSQLYGGWFVSSAVINTSSISNSLVHSFFNKHFANT